MALTHSIAAFARRAPDKTAVVFNGEPLSYAAFSARIDAVRGHLARAGIPRDRVAVLCIEHLRDGWIVGLALRGLGVTTVVARTTREIAALGLGEVSVVTTALEHPRWNSLDEGARAAGAPLFVVPSETLAGQGADAAPPIVAEQGAQILLTSGTTGLYKKVLLDAAGEADVVAFNTDLAAITAETIFDVMHFGLWTGASYIWPAMTWTAGGTVVFNQGRADWRPFTETPTPTHVAVTPQMLDELLSAPASAYPRPPTLVLITVGGVVSRAQWRGTCERLTDDVRSVYGATETCLMTFTPVRTEDDLVWHRAHDDILQVVDDQDRPMAPDETGFLRLRASRGEAGYLNDPQTSRAFFRGGWFYPGDLAVADAEGRVSLQGRVTDVINLLGSKYPTIPMERGLQERLGARAVCVFSMPGLDGEAVHVAIEPGAATITAEALREALAACLPRMTQVQVHKVESLPRNHMGKVDRAALRGLLAKSGSSG